MTITHTKVSAVADGGDATKVQPTDWNASHTIAAGYSLVRTANLILTNAQMEGLPNAAVQIIAAPGANKAILTLGASISTHIVEGGDLLGVGSPSYLGLFYGSGPLRWNVNADDVGLYDFDYNNDGLDIVASLLLTVVQSIEINLPLLVKSGNGSDFTGGEPENTMTVNVFYTVVDL